MRKQISPEESRRVLSEHLVESHDIEQRTVDLLADQHGPGALARMHGTLHKAIQDRERIIDRRGLRRHERVLKALARTVIA